MAQQQQQQRKIIIPYQPREWALQLHNSKKRWNVIVAHRRAGKTVATINHLIRDACTHQNARYAYIAPTYKQAKNIAWDYLKHFSSPIPKIKINESELKIDYPTGSRITLFGAENADALRGLALWGVVFDEYSQQPSNIFSEIIRPALADNKGYAIWIGTPKGKNEFYRLYLKAKQYRKTWFRLLLTVDDTNILDKKELEDARQVMTEDEYRQEFYCSFEASIKGAYYAKEIAQAHKEGRITRVPHEPTLPVHTFWDLGYKDYTSIGFFQKVGLEYRMIDFYQNHGEALNHYVKVIREKPYTYGTHNFPHDVIVKELGSGKSRKEILESLGIEVNIVMNIPVQDGINAARLIFNKLWIDEKNCSEFIDAISQYRQEWDDKAGMFKNKPLHDWTSHAADMFRYFAVGVNNITNNIDNYLQQQELEYKRQQKLTNQAR